MRRTKPQPRELLIACAAGVSAALMFGCDAAVPTPARADAPALQTHRTERSTAQVVWRRPEPAGSDHALCGVAHAHLDIEEVRLDDTTLYFDVVHASAQGTARGRQRGAARPERSEAAALELRVNGCPAKRPPLKGRVVFDAAHSGPPSTVTLALADLPDGELDLAFRAFEVERLLPLRKQGKSVTYLETHQRSNFEFIPADPVRGYPAAVSLDEPDCSKVAK